MRGLFPTVCIALLIFAIVQPAIAQPIPPVNAPVDGLVSLLLLAGGGALAARKIRKTSNR